MTQTGLSCQDDAVERPSEQADDAEAFEQLCSKGFEMSRRVAAGKARL